jgi:hypothetical protein
MSRGRLYTDIDIIMDGVGVHFMDEARFFPVEPNQIILYDIKYDPSEIVNNILFKIFKEELECMELECMEIKCMEMKCMEVKCFSPFYKPPKIKENVNFIQIINEMIVFINENEMIVTANDILIYLEKLINNQCGDTIISLFCQALEQMKINPNIIIYKYLKKINKDFEKCDIIETPEINLLNELKNNEFFQELDID